MQEGGKRRTLDGSWDDGHWSLKDDGRTPSSHRRSENR